MSKQTGSRPTRWEIKRGGASDGVFEDPAGRQFKVDDYLNLPPPTPKGSMWRVIAVEETLLDGYEGILILEHAQAIGENA